ncbi:MAG: hypothetical protein K6E79_06920 [Pseudobutyrivibrio sp.]|nr:hypothetical protein [Pseudobutyrivibrio sp.]
MEKKKFWFPSLVLTVICLAILWKICPICFQNNDDKALMYLTAGYTTGTPEAGTVFGSFYYYGFIALLYKIYAGFAWYTIIELAMVAVSLWIVCDTLMNVLSSKGKLLGVVSCIILFLFVFLHFSTALQYTATAGMVAGAAACALIASLDGMDKETTGTKDWHFIVSVIMLVVAYGIRKQFGIVGLGAMLCILFFEFFTENRALIVKKGIIILIAFLVAFGSNAIYEKATGISDFNEYYAQAGTWIDYPHLEYANDTEGVYASVGWDEPLYNAVSNWFFMDERLTTDNFKVLVDAYDGNDLSMRDYYDRAHNLMLSSMIVNIQLVIWIAILLIINVAAFIKHLSKRQLLMADGLFAMFAVVSVYFLIEGRFPMRAYQALVFIFMVPSVIVALRMMAQCESRRLLVIAVAAMALIPVAGSRVRPETNILDYTYTVAHDIYRTADIEKSTALENYAIQHPDGMFIYDLDLALPAGPFTVYKDGLPKNLVFWGGWVYNTPMYWKQIHANGFDTLYSADFLSGRVFFCGNAVSDTLVQYMQSQDQLVHCDVVDQVGDMVIYQFTK